MEFPEQLNSFVYGRHVCVSFSGGADSLALLLLLKLEADRLGFTVRALHFEHGLRGEESLRDEVFCRSFCMKCGIPYTAVSLNVPDHRLPDEGDEAAARRLRRAHWRKEAQNDPLLTVALGHNANDRRENLILRLARGSNATGLTSMRASQTVDGVALIRPLLRIPRSDIEAYLKQQGITQWNHDSTNDSDDYSRNRIRHNLLPLLEELLPYSAGGLDRALDVLEEDALTLEFIASSAYQSCAGTGILPDSVLLTQPPAVQIRILRLFLNEVLGRDYVPDKALLDRAAAALKTGHGLIPLKESADRLTVSDHALRPVQPVKEVTEGIWHWKKDPEYDCGTGIFRCLPADSSGDGEVFDGGLLPESFLIAKRKDGDRMIPFGSTSPVKVKKLLTDGKIPAEKRNQLPLLCSPDGEILWIPAVRRSRTAPVTAETVHPVRLIFTENR